MSQLQEEGLTAYLGDVGGELERLLTLAFLFSFAEFLLRVNFGGGTFLSCGSHFVFKVMCVSRFIRFEGVL